MLRWKTQYIPLLVSVTLVAFALLNAAGKGGGGVNWAW
jgi:hypothetical protein